MGNLLSSLGKTIHLSLGLAISNKSIDKGFKSMLIPDQPNL